LYFSLDIVRVIKSIRLRSVGHLARMKEGRSVFKPHTGKSIGKRLLRSLRRRWVSNVRIYRK